MDNNSITCLVRGPASRYPSGYLWLYPAWFVILGGAAFEVVRRITGALPPLWVGACMIGGLLVAGLTALCVLVTATRAAFRADGRGILLGSRNVRRRTRTPRQVVLAWPEVAQVCLVPRHYGVLAEIMLSPYAAPLPRPTPGRRAGQLLGSLIMPAVAGRHRPALTVPRPGQPRYRVKICYLSAAELRFSLAQLAPASVPVRVFTSRRAMRRLSGQPGKSAPWPGAQPAWSPVPVPLPGVPAAGAPPVRPAMPPPLPRPGAQPAWPWGPPAPAEPRPPAVPSA